MQKTRVWSLGWEDPLEEGNPFQGSCLENPHGQRSLVGYSPWGCKQLNMTGVTEHPLKWAWCLSCLQTPVYPLLSLMLQCWSWRQWDLWPLIWWRKPLAFVKRSFSFSPRLLLERWKTGGVHTGMLLRSQLPPLIPYSILFFLTTSPKFFSTQFSRKTLPS